MRFRLPLFAISIAPLDAAVGTRTTTRSFGSGGCIIGTPLLSQEALAQASYYWDTNGTSVGSGSATGTWGTDIFWNSDSTGSLSPGVTTTRPD